MTAIRMGKAEFFRWLDEQIPNADDLRKQNPWFAYEAAKRQVKRNLMTDWQTYDYYQKMFTFWSGVYK
jgi:hypothetical protein